MNTPPEPYDDDLPSLVGVPSLLEDHPLDSVSHVSAGFSLLGHREPEVNQTTRSFVAKIKKK